MSYFVISKSSQDILHFGIKHRSGRYPYGSGERPYQDREDGVLKKKKYSNTSFAVKTVRDAAMRIVDKDERKKYRYQKEMGKMQREYNNMTADQKEYFHKIVGFYENEYMSQSEVLSLVRMALDESKRYI